VSDARFSPQCSRQDVGDVVEDDLYVAECLEVGTVSQGYTVEEAVANLKEATELYLEEFPLSEMHSVSPPVLTTFEATYA